LEKLRLRQREGGRSKRSTEEEPRGEKTSQRGELIAIIFEKSKNGKVQNMRGKKGFCVVIIGKGMLLLPEGKLEWLLVLLLCACPFLKIEDDHIKKSEWRDGE
jgi:hypothetical protein